MLAAATYLSWLGGKGLHELSALNFTKGQDLKKKIVSIPGYTIMFTGVHFNEFVIRCPDVKKVHNHLLQNGIQGGLPLRQWYPRLADCMVFGITEMHSDDSIKRLISLLKEVR